MNFSCTKENLHRGLSVVSHITTKNINLPILNNVLIKTENKTLKLVSTNLEIATTCVVRGKIEGEGDFTVPAKLFADYINLLPNERVDCNEENSFLSIKCGNYKTKIKGIPAADFPLIPQISKESSYRVYAPDLKCSIERVIFAASTNESRPEISGVFISFNPDGMEGRAVLAATDSYRLSELQLQLNSESQSNKKESVIVPARTLAELLRIISVVGSSGEGSDVIEISIGENQILFSYNGIELSSRLIEGQYPDYQHVIPSSYSTITTLSRDALIKAVKMASLFTKSGLNDVKLEINPDKKLLEVSSTNNQTGENTSNIEVESEGPSNHIILNYRYLIDGLNNLEGDKIRLKLIDGASPCLLESADDKSGMKYIYIVMPIKI